MVEEDITHVFEEQKKVEDKYQTVAAKKFAHPDINLKADTAGQLRYNIKMLSRSLKQSPVSQDNLVKMQHDR